MNSLAAVPIIAFFISSSIYRAAFGDRSSCHDWVVDSCHRSVLNEKMQNAGSPKDELIQPNIKILRLTMLCTF